MHTIKKYKWDVGFLQNKSFSKATANPKQISIGLSHQVLEAYLELSEISTMEVLKKSRDRRLAVNYFYKKLWLGSKYGSGVGFHH